MPEIPEFTGNYRFLSNFYASPVSIRGRIAPTVEHAFQAAKSRDSDWFHRIIEAPTPNDAKRMGGRIEIDLREDWEQVKCQIMFFLLIQKFEPDSALAMKLVATGDACLVEGNHWHDNYWGVCTCRKCPGHGMNMLGKLLITVRNVLSYGVPIDA
jgi:ribA/ribD-fused uncharacterized protein